METAARARAQPRSKSASSSRPRPAQLLRRLRALVDRQLREVWRSCGMPRELALARRRRLRTRRALPVLRRRSARASAAPRPTPRSSAASSSSSARCGTSASKSGHSVRTVDECLALAEQDITVQTTLLESRLLAGNRALFRDFVARTSSALDPQAFLEAKQLEQQQRHARYQETNLEPNIKESAGGLRDLQTILWIARAAGIGKSWSELAAPRSHHAGRSARDPAPRALSPDAAHPPALSRGAPRRPPALRSSVGARRAVRPARHGRTGSRASSSCSATIARPKRSRS